MAVRAVAEHDSRCYKTRDRSRIAKREREVVEVLLSQSFDFFTLERRTPHHVRENLHRLLNFRRHHADGRERSIPAGARVERSAKALDLLRDLRGVTALRAFCE